MSIEVRKVSKTFGAFSALREVSLEVADGQLVALLGPSGCGKTTLLRIIAGLEEADSGEIMLNGEDVRRRRTQERGVGFVFQHYALFRHMTIFENVAFGLRVRPRGQRPGRAEIERRVAELLKLVQVEWLADRKPWQLSGGQRQRVALARALAVEPRVLLLDEPFGALDAKVRQELRRWLRRLHDELHITSVFVTHDQEEALEVADRVVVMNEGRVEQIGTPQEVYDRPASPFVYGFLGKVNLFHARLAMGRARIGNVEVEVPAPTEDWDTSAVGYVRPHDLEVARQPAGGAIEAVVRHVQAAGPTVRLELERADGGEPLEVELSRDRFGELALQPGERVYVSIRNLRVFPPER